VRSGDRLTDKRRDEQDSTDALSRSRYRERRLNNNRCIADNTKAAARQSLNCIKNKKIWRKNDFQYGGWNSCTLQCGMWLWNRDSECTKWQHPAMWYVALGWHAIEFAQTFAILEFYIWVRFRLQPQSTCHSAPVSEILSKSDHPRQKKMTSCRFSRWLISAILDFRDQIMVLWRTQLYNFL